MAVSDPIADFLTRLRNSTRAQHRYVDVPWSKIRQNIAEILKAQGYIESYLVRMDGPQRGTIRIFLKYADNRRPVIQNIQRVSRPGLRRYIGYTDIPYFYGGTGLSIVSTSQGLMAGRDAKARKIGGELICMVW